MATKTYRGPFGLISIDVDEEKQAARRAAIGAAVKTGAGAALGRGRGRVGERGGGRAREPLQADDPALRHGRSGGCRHGTGPAARVRLDDQRRRAPLDRLRDVPAAVGAPAGVREERVAARDAAAVGDQPATGRQHAAQPAGDVGGDRGGVGHRLSRTGSAGTITELNGASGGTRIARSDSPVIRANSGAATWPP